MDVEAVIAALPDRYPPDEVEIIERMPRTYADEIPHKQLMNEIGFALAIHRNQNR